MGGNSTNRLGQLGLIASIIGLTGLFLIGPFRYEPIRYLTLFSLIGLVLSLLALWWTPRKSAKWGLLLGIIGSLYLPTVFLPVFERLRGTQPDGAANRSQPIRSETDSTSSAAGTRR